MSYIHQALKKAQAEKEGARKHHPDLVAAHGEKRFFSRAKFLLCLFFTLTIIGTGLLFYWKHDHSDSDPQEGMPAIENLTLPEAAWKEERIPPADATQYYERGILFQKRNRLAEARIQYSKALEADPGHVEALNNLGVLELQEGLYDDAKRNFEKAVRLRPEFADAHYNLACLHALQGDVTQGILHLRKAASLDRRVSGWAISDPDLSNLRGLEEYTEIVKGVHTQNTGDPH
jgi:tetratricopeptide (TPR) repeat protein